MSLIFKGVPIKVSGTCAYPPAGIYLRHTGAHEGRHMCRSIRTLFNFEPPVSDDEIRAAALQFVRKVSGFHSPSKSNEPAFHLAVDEIEAASRTLLRSLQTTAPAKNREQEAAKARSRAVQRFTALVPR
jgi:hypothetical protein